MSNINEDESNRKSSASVIFSNEFLLSSLESFDSRSMKNLKKRKKIFSQNKKKSNQGMLCERCLILFSALLREQQGLPAELTAEEKKKKKS